MRAVAEWTLWESWKIKMRQEFEMEMRRVGWVPAFWPNPPHVWGCHPWRWEEPEQKRGVEKLGKESLWVQLSYAEFLNLCTSRQGCRQKVNGYARMNAYSLKTTWICQVIVITANIYHVSTLSGAYVKPFI